MLELMQWRDETDNSIYNFPHKFVKSKKYKKYAVIYEKCSFRTVGYLLIECSANGGLLAGDLQYRYSCFYLWSGRGGSYMLCRTGMPYRYFFFPFRPWTLVISVDATTILYASKG